MHKFELRIQKSKCHLNHCTALEVTPQKCDFKDKVALHQWNFIWILLTGRAKYQLFSFFDTNSGLSSDESPTLVVRFQFWRNNPNLCTCTFQPRMYVGVEILIFNEKRSDASRSNVDSNAS